VKVFVGEKNGNITVIKRGIKSTLRPRNRMSDRFCWGKGKYCSSETAYCLIANCCGTRKAELFHPAFKWDVVTKLKKCGWRLTESWIKKWVAVQGKKYVERYYSHQKIIIGSI